MISIDDLAGPYKKHPEWTSDKIANATTLLSRVNWLLEAFQNATGKRLAENKATGSHVSGTGNGGFRPKNCPVGAENSSHKEGKAVDVWDHCENGETNALDKWITDEILKKYDLYREAPMATQGWCHLTTRAPASGKRTFNP